MNAITRAKLVLAVMAAIFFAGSLRSGRDWPLWVAIALLAAAVLLRFAGPRGRDRT